MRRAATGAAVLLLVGATTSCAGEDDPDTLRVLAASSLTEVFTTLASSFEDLHPGVDVQLSFGSSTDLAGQAADGAPGSVLATADEESMGVARDAGAARTPTPFAGNVIVLATPADNPAGIRGLSDLDGATWVRCADEVPCGRAAASLLAEAGVDAEPDSLEEDARSTVDKLVHGEADAALVYRTDVIAAGEAVVSVPVPGADAVRTTYAVAVLAQAPDDALAAEFVELVLGDSGRTALDEAGFVAP